MREREVVSEAIPFDWDVLYGYLATKESLQEVAKAISADIGRTVSHQSVVSALGKDARFRVFLDENERNFAKHWPLSATERGVYVVYPSLHNLFRRRMDSILLERRFTSGWQSSAALVEGWQKVNPSSSAYLELLAMGLGAYLAKAEESADPAVKAYVAAISTKHQTEERRKTPASLREVALQIVDGAENAKAFLTQCVASVLDSSPETYDEAVIDSYLDAYPLTAGMRRKAKGDIRRAEFKPLSELGRDFLATAPYPPAVIEKFIENFGLKRKLLVRIESEIQADVYAKDTPSVEELTDLFVQRYDLDRWRKKTLHWELLRCAGISVRKIDAVYNLMRERIERKKLKTKARSPKTKKED